MATGVALIVVEAIEEVLDEVGVLGLLFWRWLEGGRQREMAEIADGHLDAEEEHAGGAAVEVATDEGLHDLVDGDLDGGAVFEEGQFDGEREFGIGGFRLAAEAFGGLVMEVT